MTGETVGTLHLRVKIWSYMMELIPIRKVSPIRVALTSYYSKLFVERSQRSVFNYDSWVGKQIVAKGQNPADDSIHNVKIADVADYTQDLPTIYSVIGSRVMEFRAGQDPFRFDYQNRIPYRVFDMATVEAIERQNPEMVVCGRRDSRYIAVDKSDMFYIVEIGRAHV